MGMSNIVLFALNKLTDYGAIIKSNFPIFLKLTFLKILSTSLWNNPWQYYEHYTLHRHRRSLAILYCGISVDAYFLFSFTLLYQQQYVIVIELRPCSGSNDADDYRCSAE